jgi:hypothetical protein
VYLIVVGWLYVAVMMSVAEANHPQGSVLGAIVTFVLYGVGPVALVIYLIGRPARRRARAARDAAAPAAESGSAAGEPDAGGEPPADPVAPMRKEP